MAMGEGEVGEGVGLESRVAETDSAARGPPIRVVCIGGGTGLPVVLRGLVRWAGPPGNPELELTAVVAMTDDGGSSGRLRRRRGILPPGDVRNCLVALSAPDDLLRNVFGYRFGGAPGLRGHALGNLVIAALAEQRGDFLEAVKVSERLLGAHGTVLPSTLAPVRLVATRADGRTVFGERHLRHGPGPVVRVGLEPERPPPSAGVLEAILSADLVILGPGSLFSSVLPNLLVDGVAAALCRTHALRVLVSNLMTEPGETDGMDCEAHVDALVQHAGPVVDAVLYNEAPLSDAARARYEHRDSTPVEANRVRLLERGILPLGADLVRAGPRARHDVKKLASCLVRLARTGVGRA